MKFAAFGRTHLLYDSIKACVNAGHEVVLIGTSPPAPEYSANEGDFRRLAEAFGCPFFCDTAINSAKYASLARESRAQMAISVNWLTMIRQEMLDQFDFGIINAHAGDLPRFRGNACPNWAILSGEEKVVATLHRMVPDLDAGPVILKRSMLLSSQTYISDVYRFLSENIPDMFVEVMNQLAEGTAMEKEQPEKPELALRCYPRVPQDSVIDWTKPAEQVARLVRSSAEPFSGAYTFIGTEKLTVWRAKPEKLSFEYMAIPGQVAEIRDNQEVLVITGRDALVLQEVEFRDSGRVRPATIITSTRNRLGMNICENLRELSKRIEKLEEQLRRTNKK